MEEIEAELEQKSIERDQKDMKIEEVEPVDPVEPVETTPPVETLEDPPPPKKTKKTRSPAQIAAFEKARNSRAANLKIKKELQAEKKLQQKQEKEDIRTEIKERIDNPKVKQVNFKEIKEEQPRYREQVTNNYYYYGSDIAGNVGDQVKPKKRKKKPVVESSSEEESEQSDPDEPDSYKELYSDQVDQREEEQQPLMPKLKFRFV